MALHLVQRQTYQLWEEGKRPILYFRGPFPEATENAGPNTGTPREFGSATDGRSASDLLVRAPLLAGQAEQNERDDGRQQRSSWTEFGHLRVHGDPGGKAEGTRAPSTRCECDQCGRAGGGPVSSIGSITQCLRHYPIRGGGGQRERGSGQKNARRRPKTEPVQVWRRR